MWVRMTLGCVAIVKQIETLDLKRASFTNAESRQTLARVTDL